MGSEYDLVCFDMDETLTRTKSTWAWIHRAFGTDDAEDTELFNKGLLSQEEFIIRDVAKWKSVKPDLSVNDICGVFNDLPLVEDIGETIDALHGNGMKCVIISGGVDIAADLLAKRFHFDDYVANRLTVNDDGTISDSGVAAVDLRDKSVETLKFIRKYNTSVGRTVSVGNSFTDIPMFRSSGLSIAFNPTDEQAKPCADHTVCSEKLSDILKFIL